MTFLRVIFGIFALVSICLIFAVFSIMKSGTPDSLKAIQQSVFPVAILAVCALVAALAAIKGGRVLSYITIGLMAIIVGIWVFIPLGIGMHYHPDENYTGWIIAFYTPIVIVAALFACIVHRHFKNEKAAS